MTLRPETENAPQAADTEAVTGDSGPGEVETVQTPLGAVRIPPKPTRPPRRRTPKLDELLADAVQEARTALTSEAGLAEDGQVGEHVGAVADDDRLVTHRFTASLPGYGGWEWFATLARAPRSKVITVCEVGLLPGEDAVLAPDWVPWSERVSQEEKIRLDAIAAGEDPEKALARARGEADAQEQSADEGNADHDDPADLTDAGTDAADVDADSDAADADAGDEPGAGEQPS
jgi:hypothetical protein